ncbi:MAG: U32 family peptidase [Kiritimatiellae bacterium]|nr:U32 family peptidase [Kiritimatiellia bacterium]
MTRPAHASAHPLPELLAPAGEYDAALAALHYGADAIYTGLPQFSARAEAVNLTPPQLEQVVVYAHSLPRPRRVYVTLNTLVREDELPEVVRSLDLCVRCGVDAIIVQDLGIARLARRHFPVLRLHASTQLAIHNLEGARAAARLGFSRVTLARELSLDELKEIASGLPVETEAFVHGALCYSYSGLCLYSALLRNRSGNRGACAYPCRDCFTCAAGSAAADSSAPAAPALSGLLFSMKDLAAAPDLPALRDTGVASLKIEGRKKSPLYVAAAVNYYRHLLDGTFTPPARAAAETDLRIIFSRPWTELHLRARRTPAPIDPAATGHRGVPVGRVEHSTRRFLHFRPTLPLEVHDGLQVELPGERRPYGFPVESITLSNGRNVFTAAPGTLLEVPLPEGAPPIPPGTILHLASSQAVKRRYPFPRPNPAHLRRRYSIDISLTPDFSATATLVVPDGEEFEAAVLPLTATATIPAAVPRATPRDPAANHAAAETALAKLGDTPFVLRHLHLPSPDALPFVPVSALNTLRRQLATTLQDAIETARTARLSGILATLDVPPPSRAAVALAPAPSALPPFLLKTDQPAALLDALSAPGVDLARISEVIVQLDPALPPDAAEALFAFLPPQVVRRVALPPVMRAWERPALRNAIRHHLSLGRAAWELANPYALELLPPALPDGTPLDLAADYPLYALNHSAADAMLTDFPRPLSRLTFSPEDTLANTRLLAARDPWRYVWPVHRDPPLFIAENCPYAASRGACPGPARCPAPSAGLPLKSSAGEAILLVTRHCRQYALLDVPQTHPLPPGLPALPRADFLLRPWTPAAIRHTLFHLL